MTLTCWHCGEDFDYDPPEIIAGRPRDFYQGYTICKSCVPCMGKTDPCKHEAA